MNNGGKILKFLYFIDFQFKKICLKFGNCVIRKIEILHITNNESLEKSR